MSRFGRKVTMSSALAAVVALAGMGWGVQASASGSGVQIATAIATLDLAGVEAPPALPKPLTPPAQPIVPGASVGYLPASWEVSAKGELLDKVPLDVVPGRGGMQPSLALNYSSNGSNGVLGMGWSLSGFSTITRCAQTLASDGVVVGVANEASDHLCLDGKKLVPISGADGADGTEYRTDPESFTKIVQLGATAFGPNTFRVWTKEGLIHDYVGISASKDLSGIDYSAPHFNDLGARPVVWALDKTTDRSGNSIHYSYLVSTIHYSYGDAVEYLPYKIEYTSQDSFAVADVHIAQRSVTFHYENRPDPISTWQSGVNYRLNRRLTSIEMQAPNPVATSKVWEYKFAYTTSAGSGRSLLTSVQRCGALGGCLWANQFGWNQQAAPTFTASTLSTPAASPDLVQLASVDPVTLIYPHANDPQIRVMDLDGDGTDDVLYALGAPGFQSTSIPGKQYVRLGSSHLPGQAAPLELRYAATGTGFPFAFWWMMRPVDIDGDGSTELGLNIPYPYPDANGTTLPHQYRFAHWNKAAQVFEDAGYLSPDINDEWVEFVDIDGDHLPDMINKTGYDGSISQAPFPVPGNTGKAFGPYAIRYNLGGIGTFGAQLAQTSIVGCAARATDLDGDGRGELIVDACGVDSQGHQTQDDPFGVAIGYAPDNTVQVRLASRPFPDGTSDQTFLQENMTRPRIRLAGDFNGDGLEDILLLPNKFDSNKNQWLCEIVSGSKTHDYDCTTTLLWNTGNGYATDPHPITIPRDVYSTLRVADVDGDGCADIVSFHDDVVSLVRSRGDGTFVTNDVPGATSDAFDIISDVSNTIGRPYAELGDFNGDGRKDILTYTQGKFVLHTQDAAYADRISTFPDEAAVWPRIVVTYSTDWSDHPENKFNFTCNYPLLCLRKGLTVVREVDSYDQVVDPADVWTLLASGRSYHYAFEDPIAGQRGNGFLGFGEMKVWDTTRAQETKITYDHRHKVGSKYPYAFLPQTVTTTLPLMDGLPLVNVTYSTPQTAHVTQSTFTHALRSFNHGKTSAVLPTGSAYKMWEQQASLDTTVAGYPGFGHMWPITEPTVASGPTTPFGKGWLQFKTQAMDFDDYGNVTFEATHNIQSESPLTYVGVQETISRSFDNRLADWLIDLPQTQAATRAESSSSVSSVTRTTDFGFDPQGRLQTVWTEKNNADPLTHETATYTYDGFGLLQDITTTATDALDQAIHMDYSTSYPGAPDERVFPRQVWASHDNTALRPSLAFIMHPMGLMLASTDANGMQTKYQYDDLGRQVSTQSDGDAMMTIAYGGRPDSFGGLNGLMVKAVQNGVFARVSTDALGRPIASEAQNFDASIAYQRLTYDLLGRVVSSAAPSADPGIAALRITTHTYDTLDRVRKMILPDSTQVNSQYSYQGQVFVTQVTDANNYISRVERDVDGRVVATSNVLNLPASSTVKTRYEYVPYDLPWRVMDDKGNVTTATYDVRGRKVQVFSPDRGAETLTYNGMSQLRQTTHVGTGATETYAYDDLGRQIEHQDEFGGITTLTWDQSTHGIGSLSSAHSPDGIDTMFAYDALGRLATLTYADVSDGKKYLTDFGYDPTLNRLNTIAYPEAPGRARFTTQYDYNTVGAVREVGDATAGQAYQMLWHADTRNADGSPLMSHLGNGLTLSNSYGAMTGRLQTSNALLAGATAPLFDMAYAYDAGGLMQSRQDNANHVYETFQHDSLLRLRRWCRSMDGLQSIDSCGANKNAGLTQYSYDSIGNLTQILKGTQLKQYTYDQSQPHTVTDVWDQSANVNAHSGYGYDARGRMNKSPTLGITFTGFDLPKTVVQNGQTWTFAYDAFGQRTKKAGPDGTTFYVPGLYERRTIDPKAITDIYHVASPDGAMADLMYEEPTQTSSMNYLLRDSLDSVAAVVDAKGILIDQSFRDPYGERINKDGSLFSAKWGKQTQGFTGQEEDASFGLINFKGRIYDPRLKRLVSADPLVSFPSFGQSWNPYSYVMNSPLNFTDPSGFEYGSFDTSPCWVTLMSCGGGSGSGGSASGGVGPGGLPSGGFGFGNGGGVGGGGGPDNQLAGKSDQYGVGSQQTAAGFIDRGPDLRLAVICQKKPDGTGCEHLQVGWDGGGFSWNPTAIAAPMVGAAVKPAGGLLAAGAAFVQKWLTKRAARKAVLEAATELTTAIARKDAALKAVTKMTEHLDALEAIVERATKEVSRRGEIFNKTPTNIVWEWLQSAAHTLQKVSTQMKAALAEYTPLLDALEAAEAAEVEKRAAYEAALRAATKGTPK